MTEQPKKGLPIAAGLPAKLVTTRVDDSLSAEMQCYTLMRGDEPRVQAEDDGGPSPAEAADMIIKLGNRVKLERRERKQDQEASGRRRAAQEAVRTRPEPQSPETGGVGPSKEENRSGAVPEPGESP